MYGNVNMTMNSMNHCYYMGKHVIFQNLACFKVLKRLFSVIHSSGHIDNFAYRSGIQNTSFKHFSNPFPKVLFTTKHRCIVTSHCYRGPKHNECDSDSDTEMVSVDYTELEPEVSDIDSLRHILYPQSSDPLICRLNACSSVQEVFDIIVENEASMNGCQLSQAVIVLWDLQKIYFRVSVSELHQDPETVVSNYIYNISNHESFKLLLHLVENGVTKLSADAAACTLLYLNKMGINMNHSVIQSLVSHCEDLVDKLGSDFPLTSLSRYTVALHTQRRLWFIFSVQKMLPHIFSRIESCKTAEEFRQVTICLNNIHQLVTSSILEKYKTKAEDLISNGIITSEDPRVIIKAIIFLNYPYWSQNNIDSTRVLLTLLKGKLSSLEPSDLVTVHGIFQIQLEPADILDEIQDVASQLLSRESKISNPLHNATEILSCVTYFSSSDRKKVLEKLTYTHMESNNFSTSMATLFKILRHLKTSDVHLCDTLWSKTLKHLQMCAEEREVYKLLRVCQRYMHFNNNLGGTYRHYEFEKQMICWLLEEVENGISGLIPSKFSRIAAFLLAYGGTKPHKDGNDILNEVTKKLVEMAPQLNEFDCFHISRGFQIALNLQPKNSIKNVDHFVRLDTLLNECASQQLQTASSLPVINLMARTYINRRGASDTDLFQSFISRYKSLTNNLSSRQIRDIAYNLLMSNCLAPETVDNMVEYVLKHNVRLLGDTVEKVLFLCFSQGYTPTQADAFLPIAAQILVRDKNRLSGLKLLQAALALSFFHSLPESLVHFIFTVDFLEKLDEEILHCYSKATYPVRVRHYLMQLNRAVCLDYPEVDVPWFHQKYCQEVAALDPVQASHFYLEVKKLLTDILGGKDLVKSDVFSAYGYKIDFQVLLKNGRTAVNPRHHADKDITRVAVLLYRQDAFCTNLKGHQQLKGSHQLKQRHLEMLGYRVVGLNTNLWHSMFMAEPGAKEDLLRGLLWPDEAQDEVKQQYQKS